MTFVYVDNQLYHILHHGVGHLRNSYFHIVETFLVEMPLDNIFCVGDNVLGNFGAGSELHLFFHIVAFAAAQTLVLYRGEFGTLFEFDVQIDCIA